MPPAPKLERYAASLLKGRPIYFSKSEQVALIESLVHAAEEFKYRLPDVTVQAWHLHWIIAHDDAPKTMVGRLKTRMRQALGRGRIWTKGYCAEQMTRLAEIDEVRAYIAKHFGCRMTSGKRRNPEV